MTVRLLCSVLCTFLFYSNATAQRANYEPYFVPYQATSGTLFNASRSQSTLYSHLVHIKSAPSMQIEFGPTHLPDGTMLRLTSLKDGATQHLNATTFDQWQGNSAWFNGSSVLVELIAEPKTNPAQVTIKGATLLRVLGDERSICDGIDDREPSNELRDARAIPSFCSAWIIDDPNHTLLTAGHCCDGGASIAGIATIEFNVPQSDSSGNPQHPDPSDQYPSDPESLQGDLTGLGNDWAYFGCFPNSETGLTPFEAQQDFYVLASQAPSGSAQGISITGYGSTDGSVPNQLNLAQKVHSGPYVGVSGTTIMYRVDTSGGNSGSAVLNLDTNESIGIHTNAGCGDNGAGANHGCAINNSGLQFALANPQGVCIPNIMNFDFSDALPLDVDPTIPTTISFSVIAGGETPIPNSVKVVLNVNGIEEIINAAFLGGEQYEVTLPGFDCGDDVRYYFEARGDGGTILSDPEDAPTDQHPIIVGTVTDEIILTESFDTGYPSDWSTSGLWTMTFFCAPANECDEPPYAYFGNAANCNYNENNDPVSGSVMTPVISVAGTEGSIILSFCNALQTEFVDGGGFDLAELYVNGALVEQVENSLSWEVAEYDITDFVNDTVQVEWRFDSIDGQNNDFRGWHIDGINIIARTVECVMPDPTGACCVEDVCSILTQADCSGTNGAYLGNDSACDNDPCAFTGACCVDTSCSLLTLADCDALGGTYHGDNAPCTSTLCDPTGACCQGTTCNVLSEADCDAALGTYQGDESTCDAGLCSCPTDLNGDFVVDVSDLLLVIDAWGSNSGNADINGDGIVDVGDLLEIVGNWGPCV